MPLFRRRTPPPVNENAAKLATALGAVWAMSGRPKMTDRALIRVYVETFTELMHGVLLDEEHMALTPDFYAGGYEEGLKASPGQVTTQVLKGLDDLDRRVQKRFPHSGRAW